jgi:hypothetical protein
VFVFKRVNSLVLLLVALWDTMLATMEIHGHLSSTFLVKLSHELSQY